MEIETTETSFFIPENDEDFSSDGGIYQKLYDIKMKGTIWRFHKNDKDPFPSNPHGHNIETGEKLNPFTGVVYDRNKAIISQFSPKKVLFVQSKLKERGFIF